MSRRYRQRIENRQLTLSKATCFAIASAVTVSSIVVSGFIAPNWYVKVSPVNQRSSAMEVKQQISAILTYYQSQTDERRENQKDIRDDDALLLLVQDPDSQSQSDQYVCASEQRPLHSLLQCQSSQEPN
jgi:hypothetical protein